MWRGLLFVALVVGACKGEAAKQNPPAEVTKPAATPPRESSESARGEARDMLFIPAAITNHLAGADVMFAIDLTRTEMGAVVAKLPAELGCARDLLTSVGIIVVAKGSTVVGYVTKLPEAQTRSCFDKLIPSWGGRTRTARDGTYELEIFDLALNMSWGRDIVLIRQVGAPPPPTGIPGPQLLGLARQVPVSSEAFLLSTGFPDRKVKSTLIWVRFLTDAFEITGRIEGAEPGVAHREIGQFLEGIKEGLAEKQITVDDSWIKQTVVEPWATIEARIPFAVFIP